MLFASHHLILSLVYLLLVLKSVRVFYYGMLFFNDQIGNYLIGICHLLGKFCRKLLRNSKYQSRREKDFMLPLYMTSLSQTSGIVWVSQRKRFYTSAIYDFSLTNKRDCVDPTCLWKKSHIQRIYQILAH